MIISLSLLAHLCLGQEVIVLGTAQDGGFPHIGCQNECQKAYKDPKLAKFITSLALVDSETKQWWLFEASPDMDDQLQYFSELTEGVYPYLPSGIFLTHAHIGHYAGLITLGREAMGAKGVKVYALPRMIEFLQTNGPWSQLVKLGNIDPVVLTKDLAVELKQGLTVAAFTVPHRDEFSETAGFKINKKGKSYLFIPDIDKWSKWDQSIVDILKDTAIEYAFLDATFYADGELPNRAMSEVPHPFVKETMNLFKDESRTLKRKVVFIHFNHTNPLLFDRQTKINVLKKGYNIAEQGKRYD
ncbi:MAG: MBL fold metallo-hydrolase [Ekhidna sp.]